ncbi:MAG: ATP-binding protein [Planctomycetes bacterium]|nr:ATP-binding protein [Planctomycetota bacterium]
MARRAPAPASKARGKIRPADPFDLIRLIARSQTDPRKALAELVQNSLEAQARAVRVRRFRRGRLRCLSVRDDGRGVFPEEDRRTALERIATNIGHSYKLGVSASERRALMMQGKYGIGILGFWCVGHAFEMRTRVGGSPVLALRMWEDSDRYEIFEPGGHLPVEETWTEVLVADVHTAAWKSLVGRRAANYLAAELRGQILGRGVRLEVLDEAARGRAEKAILVEPVRFRGERLPLPERVPVPSRSPIRIDLHVLGRDEGTGRVRVESGGTVVCDDLAALEGFDFAREPWSLGRLEGVVEFPDFDVAPGSRRGVVPNASAQAFAEALAAFEPAVGAALLAFDSRREEKKEVEVLRELRRVFRELPRLLPHYDLFPILGLDHAPASRDLRRGEEVDGAGEGGALPPEERDEPRSPESRGEFEPALFPPGPLAAVSITPARPRVEVGARKALRAHALDADGRKVEGEVAFSWTVVEGEGAVDPADGPATTFLAGPAPSRARVDVAARQGEHRASSSVDVAVVEELGPPGSRDAGIPPLELVDAPLEEWRSRLQGNRWEVNRGHPDYRAAAGESRRRLRYLVLLFAKEIVLRNSGDPGSGRALERMVEVLTHVDGGA